MADKRRSGIRARVGSIAAVIPRGGKSGTAEERRSGLDALREWVKKDRPGEREPVPEACAVDAAGLCDPLDRAPGPEQIVHFRQAVLVDELAVDVGDPVEAGMPVLEIGCIPIAEASAWFAMDLRYEQRWVFEQPLRGALSASLALAPGETLSISMRNTQRKQFDRETVDEVERTESAESTIADKDVLNVTRSSSRTNNWSINGNASLSLSAFSVGASGSVSETVTQAATSSAERTSEATSKSSSNLRTLQKVQIKESTEVTTEQTRGRTIVNPYRDRAMRVDAYEMLKRFCVEFHLVAMIPAMIIRVERVAFDRAFVLANGAFLADELVDRWLEAELTEALQGTDLTFAPAGATAQQRAEEVAWLALHYLFGDENLFGWPAQMPPMISDFGRPDNWDESDPANSFREPLRSFSGFQDAVANRVGIIFTILAYYHRLYRDRVLPNDRALAVDVAMSLEAALTPRWIGVEETLDISEAIDAEQATEILRRLGGFLTMASGMLKPLLQPAEEEQAARRAAERALFVVDKVVDHLVCHSNYYTERYLSTLGRMTRMQSLIVFVEEVLRSRLEDGGSDLLGLFDPEAVFIDRRALVVPLRRRLGPEDDATILGLLGGAAEGDIPRLLRADHLAIPMDGVHVEAQAGVCVLPEVPDPPPLLPVRLTDDR